MMSRTADTQQKTEDNYRLHLSWQYSTVEFLGLPSLKENRPLTLEEIYVPLSLTWESNDKGERIYVPDALARRKHLVVLGDPGSGKSTLVKVLTYSFGRIEPTPFARRFPNTRVPVPIILRDHNVRRWQTPEDMLSDFIGKLGDDGRKDVTVGWLLSALADGRGILMLDGLDEVGNVEDRRNLRDKVVRPLLAQMPDSFALLTSRIVGYEEVPFDESKLGELALPLVERAGLLSPDAPRLSTQRCYVAPFNEEEIDQFISRWYAARERDEARRKVGWESLRQALRQNDRIKRLATNPSLLTIIALVHRVTAQLPSGRVKLYEKIVEAYLETIHNYRKVGQFPASLEQMKRWLARVGWEMQNRRSGPQEGELLASEKTVLGWLKDAINLDRDEPEEEARQFLDFIARRSGLLIQRGPDEYAFVHLTFQEYFAAWHLRGEVFDFNALVNDCLARVADRSWHETFILLFELLAEFTRAGDNLAERLTTSTAKNLERREAVAELFSALLLDDQSGISTKKQKRLSAFALSSASDLYNPVIVENLKQLETTASQQQSWPNRFDELVRQWLDDQLFQALPENIGDDFFLLAPQFVSYRDSWPEKIRDWIGKRGGDPWRERHKVYALMFGEGNVHVCDWGVQELSSIDWTKVRFSFNCLCNINLSGLLLAQNKSSRHELLAQLGVVFSIVRCQIIRAACLKVFGANSVAEESYASRNFAAIVEGLWPKIAAERMHDLLNVHHPGDRILKLVKAETLSLWQRDPSSPLFAETQALIVLATNAKDEAFQSRVESLKRHMVDTIGTDRAVALAGDPALSNKLWNAKQIFLSPNIRKIEVAKCLTKIKNLLKAKDDWTTLLGMYGLLMLGEGSSELCQRVGDLLDKGIRFPNEFTFPEKVREAADSEEFRGNLPEIFWYIFIHDPERPWLLPEMFDPNHPYSRFFLSKPREFYALAAEVLDPKGETELAKWRKTT